VDDHGDLGHLAGLQADPREAEPAAGAVVAAPEEEDEDQEDRGEDEDLPRSLAPDPVRDRRAKGEGDDPEESWKRSAPQKVLEE
jgi:hypothetical protein